jgi:hypothetical protein
MQLRKTVISNIVLDTFYAGNQAWVTHYLLFSEIGQNMRCLCSRMAQY